MRTYDIICPNCSFEFDHDTIFEPLSDEYPNYGWYKNGKCPSCESEFTFDWDCHHYDAVIVPVFLEPKFKL